VVRLMKVFDARHFGVMRLSSSDSSIIQTPQVCIAASLLPRSASSSVKYSPASVRRAVEFRIPCGPPRIRQQSLRTWMEQPDNGRDEPVA
jgi:hypothetical protein